MKLKEAYMASQESDLKEQLDRLEKLGQQWLRILDTTNTKGGNIGNSAIQVQAGGFFATILFFVVSVTLGITIAMSIGVYSRMAKIETKQDEQAQYLTAIYMMAPQLKPPERKDESANTK